MLLKIKVFRLVEEPKGIRIVDLHIILLGWSHRHQHLVDYMQHLHFTLIIELIVVRAVQQNLRIVHVEDIPMSFLDSRYPDWWIAFKFR